MKVVIKYCLLAFGLLVLYFLVVQAVDLCYQYYINWRVADRAKQVSFQIRQSETRDSKENLRENTK